MSEEGEGGGEGGKVSSAAAPQTPNSELRSPHVRPSVLGSLPKIRIFEAQQPEREREGGGERERERGQEECRLNAG